MPAPVTLGSVAPIMHETSQLEGQVSPVIALALLEALRSTDRPQETLHDEDVQRSLPRRLGLSNVVEKQIERYTGMRTRGRRLAARELGDLFRLVGRRADADAVFAEAGRTLATQELESRGTRARMISRILPFGLRRRVLLRAMEKMARAVSPGTRVRIERDPATLIVQGSLPAMACNSTLGCEMLSMGFTTFGRAYLRRDCEVYHPECEGAGQDQCVWRVELISPTPEVPAN